MPVPNAIREEIRTLVAQFGATVEKCVDEWLAVRDPVAFREAELAVAAMGREVADATMALVLKTLIAEPVFQADASVAARTGARLRHGGTREVGVTLLGGSEVRVKVEYLKANRRGRVGRPRKVGRRGKGGTGFYPVLAALGIWYGVTPALCGEVCRQVADSDSVRAGRAALDRRGIDLGHKQTLRIVNKFGARAVQQRDKWVQEAADAPAIAGILSGKRVVIATDGGRLRERLVNPRARRSKETGHRPYEAPWREPKLLTIYVIGDDGGITDTFQPIYDGTLGDADAIFEMLAGYLKSLGAHQASQLIMAGDGAKWIWERTPKLAERLGLAADKLTQVIDWCHAVGVLHAIADVPGNWSAKEKESWLRRAKKHLHAGAIPQVVELINSLAVGRRAKDISEHRDYFVRNTERMQYAAFEAANIPTGSGAIESAVRRIVNMRMKSNGMFWLEDNAEAMLLVRSYLKAGYLDSLIDWSLVTAIPWWRPQIPEDHARLTPLGIAMVA